MGSSKSEKNVLCVLVMIDCTLQMFKEGASKTLSEICDRVYLRNNQCFALWNTLEKKEVSVLHERIKRYDAATFNGINHHPSTYTSTMIGLAEDVYKKVNGPRKSAIYELINALKHLHRYHDRKLDRFNDYALAGQYLNRWDEAA